jgi:NADPH:quinone reductase-like Zn-dependent oxidoreductase
MTAISQDRYGTADVLETRTVGQPQPREGQVVVRIRAAGVNPADWAVMSGLPYIARPVYGMTKPKHTVRGTDMAGTIETVGPGVTRFKVGDEVFGSADGSYADYAVAAEDELAIKPSNLSFEAAAATPMAGLVAQQALRGIKSGDKVLVNGAAGGVGTFAVQIAKARGAEVTAVCSTRSIDLMRSLGADHVIDYTRDDFTPSAERYDLILDNVSNHSLSDLRRALTPTGTLIPNGGGFENRWFASAGRLIKGKAMFAFGDKAMLNFLVSMKAEHLQSLSALIEGGSVTPVMDRTYPLSQAAEAIAHVGEGHARGKTVISIQERPTAPDHHIP